MEENATNSHLHFTLLEVLNRPKVALTSCFLLLLILCILAGNFLVIWTILTTRRLRFPAFFFVASLAVADFLVGLVLLPISLAYHLTFEMKGRWIFGYWTCKAWLLANFWFCSASVLNLCLVSWDRYVAVTYSLHYKLRMSDARVQKMIAISWTLSFSLATVLITGIHLKTGPQTRTCNLKSLDHIFTALGVLFLFFLPVLFLGFVNSRVWLVARDHKRRIHINLHLESRRVGNHVRGSLEAEGAAQSTSIRNGWTLTRTIKQEIKTFKTFLVAVGVFVVCWCPFYSSMIVNIFRPLNSLLFYYLTIILGYCNSALNVFIYGIFNREFRKALITTVRCLKKAR